MRGLFSTSEGRVTYHPPLDEAEDAKHFCPHCHSRLNTTTPTILPPPWFDHQRREVIIGDERRKIPGGQLFRLLVILWERPDWLLSQNILMSLLYPNPDTAPRDKIIDIYMLRLRQLLTGTPYSILNRFGEGYIFTAKPPHAREIARRAKRKSMGALAFVGFVLIAALCGPACAQQASDPAVSAEFLLQFKQLHADTAADLALAQARQVVLSRELQAARAEIAQLRAAAPPPPCTAPSAKEPPT
jgi:DNA-binding winged helix-turn-helix (wHTH) protein